MPQAVAWFVYYVVVPALEVFVGYEAAIAIVNFAIIYAASAALTAAYAAIKGVPDFSEKIEAQTVTTRETLAHQRIIYGETLVSGPIWYLNTTGTDNKELYLGIVLAGHTVNSMTDVYLDGNIIPAAYISSTGAVTSGDYRGDTAFATAAYFWSYNGSQTSVSSILRAEFAGHISSKHIGHDIAWMLCRLDYFTGQTQVWSRGAPTNFKRLVRGKHVYDPRSDGSQSFGTGPLRVDSIPTWQYSDNPALCWADYMIDSKLGFGEDSARIDYGYVASAANICDAIVYTPVGTSRRFTCNGVLSTGDDHQTNIESLLSSFNGTVGLLNGTWKIRAFSYETPTLSLTDDMAAKDVKIKLHDNDAERYNTVRGYFVDPERLWQANQFPNFSASEYVARDDGKVLYRDIQLDMTKDIYMAQRLAAGILEQSDNQATVVFPGNYMVMPAEIGGTVMYTSEKLGWTNKVFRIQRYSFDEVGGVGLVMREDSAAAYADVATNEYMIPASKGGYTVNNPGVPAPSSFSINPGPEGIYLNWTPPAARLYDYTEIWRNSSVNSFDSATLTYLTRTDNYIDAPKTQGVQYYFLRSRNAFGDVSTVTPYPSGLAGLFVSDTTLTNDPAFEFQGLGQSSLSTNNVFWSDIRSIGGVTANLSINSDTTGATETPYLRYTAIGSQGSTLIRELKNTKWSPIIPGLKVNMWLQYRVPVYSNIASAYILFWIDAATNFGGLRNGLYGAPLGVGSRGIGITNSIGWTVFSDTLSYTDLTLTSSYTILSTALRFYSRTSAVATGSITIDVDKVFLNYVSG